MISLLCSVLFSIFFSGVESFYPPGADAAEFQNTTNLSDCQLKYLYQVGVFFGVVGGGGVLYWAKKIIFCRIFFCCTSVVYFFFVGDGGMFFWAKKIIFVGNCVISFV